MSLWTPSHRKAGRCDVLRFELDAFVASLRYVSRLPGIIRVGRPLRFWEFGHAKWLRYFREATLCIVTEYLTTFFGCKLLGCPKRLVTQMTYFSVICPSFDILPAKMAQ